MRALMVGLLAFCLGGCILPLGVVEHYKPDPDRDKAVEIRDIVDGKVLLVDGKGLGIAGADLRLVPPDEQLRRDLAADQEKFLSGTYVLVAGESAGKARLTAINHRRTEESYEGLMCPLLAGLGSKYHSADVPVMILIPIIVDVSERWDVGEALLAKGLATADGQSNPKYKAAEEKARKAGVGIWMGPAGRLLDLIERDRPQDAMALIEKGVNPDAADAEGTALTHAISKGQRDVAMALLTRGADPNKTGRQGQETALLLACKSSDIELARRLIEKGADVNKATWWDHRPLHEAARAGNIDIVSFLLDHGANVDGADNLGTTPLGYAAESNRTEVAMMLLKKGASFGKGGSGEPAVVHFARNGNLEMVKVLVESGASVEACSAGTPLNEAAGHGHIAVAEYLLAKGAKINERDRAGFTPLKTAMVFGQQAMAEFLRARGAKE